MDPDFIAKYSAKLGNNSHLSPNNICVLWHGALKAGKYTQYGVMCVKINNKWKTITVHRLQYMLANHINITNLDSDMDVSHLCHNTICIKPDHLSYEPRYINNNRIACKGRGTCSGHNEYRDCLFVH